LGQQAAQELKIAQIQSSMGWQDVPDHSLTEDTILNTYYGGKKLLALGNATKLYSQLWHQGYTTTLDKIRTDMGGMWPGDMEFNKMLEAELMPLFEANKDELLTGSPTDQPDGAGVGGSAKDAINKALDE